MHIYIFRARILKGGTIIPLVQQHSVTLIGKKMQHLIAYKMTQFQLEYSPHSLEWVAEIMRQSVATNLVRDGSELIHDTVTALAIQR